MYLMPPHTFILSRRPRFGFTLIELLVVITIIVVLLALLTPALDKAIYRANLVVCMTNLRGVANGATLYAFDNSRRYFHRPGVEEDIKRQPEQVAAPWGFDDRPLILPYVSTELMVDPLSGEVRLGIEDTGNSTVFLNYDLWAGFGYRGHSGMDRLGSRMEWNRRRYSILAGIST